MPSTTWATFSNASAAFSKPSTMALTLITLTGSGEFKAMEVLKLKDIAEALEGAIDAFEKVANTVEQIAVKES